MRLALLHMRRDGRIARLHMNKKPIREKLEVPLTADDATTTKADDKDKVELQRSFSFLLYV